MYKFIFTMDYYNEDAALKETVLVHKDKNKYTIADVKGAERLMVVDLKSLRAIRFEFAPKT